MAARAIAVAVPALGAVLVLLAPATVSATSCPAGYFSTCADCTSNGCNWCTTDKSCHNGTMSGWPNDDDTSCSNWLPPSENYLCSDYNNDDDNNPMDDDDSGAVAGIAVGSVFGFVFFIVLLSALIRCACARPNTTYVAVGGQGAPSSTVVNTTSYVGYGATQQAPSYGQAPGYGAPAPGYGAPAPGYGASAPGYGAPAHGGYGAPPAGYSVPQGGYAAPPQPSPQYGGHSGYPTGAAPVVPSAPSGGAYGGAHGSQLPPPAADKA